METQRVASRSPAGGRGARGGLSGPRKISTQFILRLVIGMFGLATIALVLQLGGPPGDGASITTTSSSSGGGGVVGRLRPSKASLGQALVPGARATMALNPEYPKAYEEGTFTRSRTVAAIITNFNMPERTDALVEAIEKHVKWPVEIIVVDNGSEDEYVSKYTTVRVKDNVQTCNGWLMGLHYAQARVHTTRELYAGYWMLITSASIPDQPQMDILTPLMEHLEANPNAVAVHPALTESTTSQWNHMKVRGSQATRNTWMVDNIAVVYRAEWFDSIGWFDPHLTMAWGIDMETSWRALSEGRDIVVHQEVLVEKVTDVGYKMNRMGMKKMDRRWTARSETCDVLTAKYGKAWPHEFFYDPEILGDKLVKHWRGLCGFEKDPPPKEMGLKGGATR